MHGEHLPHNPPGSCSHPSLSRTGSHFHCKQLRAKGKGLPWLAQTLPVAQLGHRRGWCCPVRSRGWARSDNQTGSHRLRQENGGESPPLETGRDCSSSGMWAEAPILHQKALVHGGQRRGTASPYITPWLPVPLTRQSSRHCGPTSTGSSGQRGRMTSWAASILFPTSFIPTRSVRVTDRSPPCIKVMFKMEEEHISCKVSSLSRSLRVLPLSQ